MINRLVAIVTGASRGIGRGIALELGALGCAVVVNYLRNEQAAREVADTILGSCGSAATIQANVALAEDRRRLVDQTVAQFGRIDVLVNNAGIPVAERVDLLDATEASWDQILATNLKGPYFLTQLVAREMIRLQARGDAATGPKIINISSISAYATSTNRGDYCIAKAGLTMMTRLFADRLAEHGIQVFEIRPGVIETDMTASVRGKYDELFAQGFTPIRRWGQPGDVAKAVAAIVQDAFPYSTGEIINVDGGFHLRRL
jgi:NAD(P)-dependent dehydrogenase (short-subunit alcohol dehydrogenase family)